MGEICFPAAEMHCGGRLPSRAFGEVQLTATTRSSSWLLHICEALWTTGHALF